jgi:5-methylcytosine-specific restriction enzyme subunit McrC
MRTERITESVEATINLSASQAAALEASGRRLASTTSWWGERAEGIDRAERTLIRCRPVGSTTYAIRVSDAVGIVVTGSVQIVVEPKIDLRHFLYLLNASGRLPRIDPSKGAADADESFWQLVARWYLDQLQRVVQRDLIRDYRETEDQLNMVRGRILPLHTARNYYQGNPRIRCRFEDFDTDNALNRILRAAATVVAGSAQLPSQLRQRALRLLSFFDEVGELRPEDLSVVIERRNVWYADALTLARNVLIGQGRALHAGPNSAWTFLFRTPDLIEEGIRQVLQRALPDWVVGKKGRMMRPSSLRLTPDLVVNDGFAIADIKYKLADAHWDRNDLYQAVAFAAGFRTLKAAVIGFTKVGHVTLPEVQVGDIAVSPLMWKAHPDLVPEDAATDLIAQMTSWLSGQSVIANANAPLLRPA